MRYLPVKLPATANAVMQISPRVLLGRTFSCMLMLAPMRQPIQSAIMDRPNARTRLITPGLVRMLQFMLA